MKIFLHADRENADELTARFSEVLPDLAGEYRLQLCIWRCQPAGARKAGHYFVSQYDKIKEP